MEKLELKETSEGIVLDLKINPGQGVFQIIRIENGYLKIKLKEKAVKGKANLEIEKQLGRVFDSNIRIVSGLKSRQKKVLIELSREKTLEIVRKLLKNYD